MTKGAGQLLGAAPDKPVEAAAQPRPAKGGPPASGRPSKRTLLGRERTDPDRRSGTRDMASMIALADRAESSALPDHHFYLPRRSHGMALFLLLAYAFAGGVAKAVPLGLPLAAGVISVALFAAGGFFAQLERRTKMLKILRQGLLALAVVLPMACAGYALGSWVEAGLAWQWAVGTVVCINAASAPLFGVRIVSLFCAKIAIWTGFAVIDPSVLTVSALLGAALALMLVARIEWQAAEARRIASDARDRVAARAEDILRSFEESGQGWFWETDRRGQISYISPSAARVLGKTVAQLHGSHLSEIVDNTAAAERTLAFHLSARSAFQDIELRAAGTANERLWALTGRPVYDSYQNFCGFRGHGTDLTEKRRSEQQVTRLAHYDALTGLVNRVQMGELLAQILAAPRESERNCAVLMLDLDRFKQVNDTLGHPAGDALLKQVAQRLERTLDGIGRCGRLGGDEFQVIVPGTHDRDKLSFVAQEIINSLSQPYTIEEQNVVIGASVGLALAPVDGSTTDELIRNVDLALYAAKDAGRGVHRFYHKGLHSAAEERAELEKDLREAIASGDLELYYQPVVYTATEKIVGFEALMRWEHPRRGWLSPEKFIAVAEDAGLIDQLGQWALRTACADLARWPEAIRCAVNVSPLQFSKTELPTIVANALAHSGIDPARLELELTESVFLNDSAGTDAMFKALKRVGVRLALDDFGTGYSSLGYLKKAPFDKIKIDQSFVRGATEDGSRNGAIIASITSLAEALEMDTTAEGVETHDELELIRILGCSHVQGFIYHEPVSAEEAGALVAGDLSARADGPQAARSQRQVLLKRVFVGHEGARMAATLRNISEGGAMLDGLWNLPAGSAVEIEFGPSARVNAQVRWSVEDRAGVEFSEPLVRREDGTFAILGETKPSLLRALAS
ncbi:MAG: EAL domain-containing protein [Pseudomonadota bacterium]